MRIAILGTRGIPNQYGGFEQFAEYLSVGLHQRGHDVAVYIPHFHPYQEETFKGVRLHRIYSPEHCFGAAANFLYDYLCLRDAVNRGYDIALECGYQSASISYRLGSLKKTRIVTNMDGMEWMRAKWSPMVKRLTRWGEGLGVRHSHALVADNVGIQDYLREAYGAGSTCIPYGAEIIEAPPPALLATYHVEPGQYFLAIARLEPENNLEMQIEGYRRSSRAEPFLIVGNHQTPYGRKLQEECKDLPGVRFLGGIYQKPVLDALRHHTRLYLHGHSVGGTNPSLLEAMACGTLIAAHDNPFNRAVLRDSALFFQDPESVRDTLCTEPMAFRSRFRDANLELIRNTYSWDRITTQYEQLFLTVMGSNPVLRP